MAEVQEPSKEALNLQPAENFGVVPEDEGPIIEQEVLRVNHAMSPDQLAAAGRDAECLALSKAVRWHAEQRIFVNGKSTVIFQ